MADAVSDHREQNCTRTVSSLFRESFPVAPAARKNFLHNPIRRIFRQGRARSAG